MIEEAKGNLLEADTEAIVNTVNTVGVMGKGIALQFKQAWPENFKAYAKACKAGEVVPGRMFVYELGGMVNPRFIINFPTKRHWREKSRIEDVGSGLKALVETIREREIHSVAVPPLGCGNGGLAWSAVRPMIEQAFAELSDVRVLLFGPHGAPDARAMPVRTKPAKMTEARALFIKLMEQYSSLHYRRTLLEVQKLAYFLQEAGQNLRLKYQAGHYGPYADNLNKVLEVMEGHFIRGYGDSQKPDAEIDLLPGAVEQANQFLSAHAEAQERLKAVSRLIEGFETPYGMELLATVHWIVHQEAADGPKAARKGIQSWNRRKARLMKPRHIEKAWERLASQHWIDVQSAV
jgi:O-acetyl-ADP-ribose deacetylase (regulator of RNase III)